MNRTPSIHSLQERWQRLNNKTTTLKLRLKREIIPHNWSTISKYSVKRAKWLYQKAYNTTQ
jgi:hypothetical protein